MKIIIGRVDKADFPELSLLGIDVKIDSGAYTSSVHSSKIKEVTTNGTSFIQFTLLDPEHPFYNNKEFISKSYSSKIIKSSNGISEIRFMIHTEIIIFNKSFPIYLTLSERKEMKFPVLLGRKFLNKKFIINTAKKNISHKLNYKKECEL